MPLSHCLQFFWIMPKSDCNMPNHQWTSFWIVFRWVVNDFFFFLFNSWRTCTKIGYIGWYYWLAISSQSSSYNDVHSCQNSCYFLHLVTKSNLCNTFMSMLPLGIPKEQCQIERLWYQMAFEIVEQFLFLLVSCQETRQKFQQLCMWSKELNMHTLVKKAKCNHFVTTLTLGSQPRQGFAKVQAKREARESHFMLSGV
jgi:hypothetical protein